MDSTERETGIDPDGIQEISDYWAAVRPVYAGFESDMMTGSAEIYKYEMPGGQYSNLKSQVESFGLGHKFNDVKDMYKAVNETVSYTHLDVYKRQPLKLSGEGRWCGVGMEGQMEIVVSSIG